VVRIRRITDISQLKIVAEIERVCDHYPWNIDMLLSAYQHGDIFWLLDRSYGYICVSIVGDFAELHSIAVMPNCRGKHYGKILCECMIDYCKSCNVKQIFLEVAVDNIAAISLYRRLGFDHIGVRKGYYSDGKDAYTMSLLL
jgi:ribosomal-protein-alanine N-acetyltransferase